MSTKITSVAEKERYFMLWPSRINRRNGEHTNGTMNNSVTVKTERRLSSTALFWVCVLATVGIGLTVSYCSGIFGRVANASRLPFIIPKWLVIATPPVLFLHLGIALFFALDRNVYSDGARMVRGWLWAFWIATFIATSATPYFIYRGMEIASYVMSTVATALAIGTTILCYRQSIPSGAVMTVFTLVVALIMIYLAAWAF